MSKIFTFNVIIILILLMKFDSTVASDSRLSAMGEMTITIPDDEAQINLYQIAGNSAWLKVNDSLNWIEYNFLSKNEWGTLRRYWDAGRLNYNYFSFSGQKHFSEDKIFFGELQYNLDYRFNVNKALEKEPYDLDPFVLTDSTEGDIAYLGPELHVVFGHKLLPSFFWGASLNYNINRGLKNIYTETEIINTEISASIDLAYEINTTLFLGLSFRPYYNQDITKLVTQPDGQAPQTFRYRGEFEFRKYTSTKDRTAIYKGYELSPQFFYSDNKFKSILLFGYNYQWHEIFDGDITHYYDGYYQRQGYFFRTVSRYNFGYNNKTSISLSYYFKYFEDWAKEPKANFLINQAFYRYHELIFGTSHRFSDFPLEAAIEIQLNNIDPNERDFLAQKFRSGEIRNSEFHFGLEYAFTNILLFRFGYIYQNYEENKVWNYYGDYSGSTFTTGVGYLFNNFKLDVYSKYGKNSGILNTFNLNKNRNYFDFNIQLKHYFDILDGE